MNANQGATARDRGIRSSRKLRATKPHAIGLFTFCLYECYFAPSPVLLAEGIPEPPLILYGTVRSSRDNRLISEGGLDWMFVPAAARPAISTSTQLTNVFGQFSYLLVVPCETEIAGATSSSNVLQLSSLNRRFDRSTVTVGGIAASIPAPAEPNWILSSRDRGRIERVDLLVDLFDTDTDGDGLPDWWERRYCDSSTGCLPEQDLDGDGLTNREEYLHGTDPSSPSLVITDTNSELGRPSITWNSVAGFTYSVLRAERLTGDAATAFLPLRTNVPSTPPRNTFEDADPTRPADAFYLIRREP